MSNALNRRQALRAMVGGVAAMAVAHKASAAPVQTVQGIEAYASPSHFIIGEPGPERLWFPDDAEVSAGPSHIAGIDTDEDSYVVDSWEKIGQSRGYIPINNPVTIRYFWKDELISEQVVPGTEYWGWHEVTPIAERG